jgi:hypothetical protein
MTGDLVHELESVVLTQLHGVRGLCSLQLQNHIYGCYFLMEDIAMSHVTHAGTTVSTASHSFDYEKGFAEIGLRYGFLMDTKLELESWLPGYQAAWLRCFATMATSHDVDTVDKIEDTLNGVVLRSIDKEEGFFMNAVEHGALTRDWIDKVLQLLRGKGKSKEENKEGEEDVPSETVLSHAHIEKPITHEKPRRMDTTRRNKERHEGDSMIAPRKAPLHKTRKHRQSGKKNGNG